MKRKVFLLLIVVLLVIGCGKKEENKVNLNSLKEEVMHNKKIEDDGYYKKISGEVINDGTLFSEMAFITGHETYIFDPSSLKEGNFKYKKVFGIVKVNIKMYKKLKIKMYKKCNQLCIGSETSESIFNLSFKR